MPDGTNVSVPAASGPDQAMSGIHLVIAWQIMRVQSPQPLPGRNGEHRRKTSQGLGRFCYSPRMNLSTAKIYGSGDASFQAAGGEAGLRQLVDNFFDRMSSDERFTTIYDLHPEDKEISRDKLARFLCGWLGDPKLYNEKYGAIGIPRVHAHLAIATAERDQWLTCMTESVAEQPFAPGFKTYLMEQLYVPAEAVRRRCAVNVEQVQ